MRRSTTAVLAACAAALAAPAGASAADTIYGVTDGERLIRFSSEAPGAAAANIAIQGLAANEQVVGLDVRPSDDNLYAVTSANRALLVNPVTGGTRPAFGPFAPALNGQSFGVDFNPQANALRIVSDAEQNLRVNEANVTFADGNLTYAPGDAGAGSNPSIGAVAYSNNTPGATSTALFGIDSARDTLVRIDPPNAGTVATIGALNQNASEPTGFDIAPAGNTGYAAFRVGEGPPALYRIDLNTGRATPAADPAQVVIPEGAGNLVDIAVIGATPDDNTRPNLSVAFSSTILEQNTNPLRPSVSCNETCTVTIEAEVQGREAGEATGQIVGAGRRTIEIPLNAAARARLARSGTELLSLDISAVDAAGNQTTQNNRVSRTQTLSARRSG
jgi:hypothetical protein